MIYSIKTGLNIRVYLLYNDGCPIKTKLEF